jgi:DNA-binding CsgD family transcriptional regulator
MQVDLQKDFDAWLTKQHTLGKSSYEIARESGLSQSWITQRINKLQLPKRLTKTEQAILNIIKNNEKATKKTK